MRPAVQYALILAVICYLVGSTVMLVKLNKRVGDLEHGMAHLVGEHNARFDLK